MATTAKMEKMAHVEKLTKMALDKEIKDFLALDKKIKEEKAKLDEKKVKLEARYVLPADVKELLEGYEYFMEKVTVRRDKEVDVKQLKVLLEACGLEDKKLIKRHTVYDIDNTQIKKYIKEGVIPAEAYEKLVSYKTVTFKSKFGTIE